MEESSLGVLQRAVLDAVESADKSPNRVITMNPHLWRPEVRRAAYQRPEDRLQPWDTEWSVLNAFLARHPDLGAGDFRLAYHGAKHTHNVKHILLEGLDRKHSRQTSAVAERGSFFGATIDACKSYGDVVLFIIPNTAWNGFTRGDGAFQARKSLTHCRSRLTNAPRTTITTMATCSCDNLSCLASLRVIANMEKAQGKKAKHMRLSGSSPRCEVKRWYTLARSAFSEESSAEKVSFGSGGSFHWRMWIRKPLYMYNNVVA